TKPMRTLILIVALALSGCSALEERPQGSVTFSELGKGQLYGNGAEGIPASPQAIGDPAHWKALLDQMDRVDPQTEGLRGAAIDCSTQMVRAVFDRVRGSGGHRISITKIVDNGTALVVPLATQGPSGMAIPVRTQPYLVVSLTRTN